MLIIFDLDDTLIDTTKKIAPAMFIKTFQKLLNSGLEIENKKKALDNLFEIDKKTISSNETILSFLQSLNANKKFYDIALNEMHSNLDSNIKNFIIDGAIEFLYDIKEKNKLFLVTYGYDSFQNQKLKKAGLDKLFFSKIYIVRNDKGLCFKKIIDNNNIDTKNVIVIGDKIDTDLMPAKKLGCITVHMKYGKGLLLEDKKNIVDYTVNKLDDIKTIIRKIGVKNDDK
ncbi:MAG: Phosphoglycolate phosphatase [Candidatus Anoxychlamydiales bacterium]|nr:Phosphoglycolate phosphatase [Candidatus Anoxychlamydiales bacterium]